MGGTVSVPLGSVLLAMISTHLLIGIGEGVITALIVSLLLRVRSDLIYVKTNEEKNNKGSSVYGIFLLLILGNYNLLLVDAVNGNIPGYVKLSVLKSEVAASTSFADFQLRIAAL